ncbi:hypothetical protein ACOIEN_26965, partial [Klebsiella pneumoniae]
TVLSTLNNLKSIPCINAFTGRANNSYLWRYVMEDHKDEFGATTIKCFYLREEISEDYVSIYHSNKDYYEGMVRDVHKRIPVGKTKPAIYLSFDAAEVIEQVNKPDKCIDIKDEGYPHLGLWYLFDINDEFTLIEVTTTILELSSFFQRNEGGVVVPL